MAEDYQTRLDIDRLYNTVWDTDTNQLRLASKEQLESLLIRLGLTQEEANKFNFALVNGSEYWIMSNAYYDDEMKKFIKIDPNYASLGIQLRSDSDNAKFNIYTNPTESDMVFDVENYDYSEYTNNHVLGAVRDSQYILYNISTGWTLSNQFATYEQYSELDEKVDKIIAGEGVDLSEYLKKSVSHPDDTIDTLLANHTHPYAPNVHYHGNIDNNGVMRDDHDNAQPNLNVVTGGNGKLTVAPYPTMPQPSSDIPLADTTGGNGGVSDNYARKDHTHPRSTLYATNDHTHDYSSTYADIDHRHNGDEVYSSGYGGNYYVNIGRGYQDYLNYRIDNHITNIYNHLGSGSRGYFYTIEPMSTGYVAPCYIGVNITVTDMEGNPKTSMTLYGLTYPDGIIRDTDMAGNQLTTDQNGVCSVIYNAKNKGNYYFKIEGMHCVIPVGGSFEWKEYDVYGVQSGDTTTYYGKLYVNESLRLCELTYNRNGYTATSSTGSHSLGAGSDNLIIRENYPPKTRITASLYRGDVTAYLETGGSLYLYNITAFSSINISFSMMWHY